MGCKQLAECIRIICGQWMPHPAGSQVRQVYSQFYPTRADLRIHPSYISLLTYIPFVPATLPQSKASVAFPSSRSELYSLIIISRSFSSVTNSGYISPVCTVQVRTALTVITGLSLTTITTQVFPGLVASQHLWGHGLPWQVGRQSCR